MIFDRLCNLDRYRGISPNIDRGIDFLQAADLTALPLGRVEIVGDEVYGRGKNPFHLEGQTLHAMVLGFVHPSTGEYMEFEAPLPEYFQNLLQKLPKQ